MTYEELMAKEFTSLKHIVGSDEIENHVKGQLIVALCSLTVILVGLLLDYYVFRVDKDLMIAFLVIGGVFTLLFILLIIQSIIVYFHLKKQLKGARLFWAKMTEKVLRPPRSGHNGQEAIRRVAARYTVEINGDQVVRVSYYLYSEDAFRRLKKMKYFPILYNEKYDNALYFSAEHCRRLNNIIRNKKR